MFILNPAFRRVKKDRIEYVYIEGNALTEIVFVFEVHQPPRINQHLFWENRLFQHVKKEQFFDYYFDRRANREIFKKVCEKCYFPSNQIFLDLIDEFQRERKQVKVSFSISGIFLEQCEMFSKDLLESFKQLADTGCVEFLGQTYYHSLASLYPEKEEFIDQIKQHQQIMRDLLGFSSKIFENTELLYNNAIAKTVEKLGYAGIFTEGVERILNGNSPNYLYTSRGCKNIKVFLRNYKLTDDIGFRFSARWWSEWPLSAEKFASWLATTVGHCINIFPDYETFGEHQWAETGIHTFLRDLPKEILKRRHLTLATPSEVARKHEPVGELDVPELSGTVSWADLERDASGWLGNTMQWAYYTSLRRLEPLVKEMNDKDFLQTWRYFQTSDHLYYMYTGGGSSGEVHSYFSPFRSPVDAFVTTQAAILDFESRVKLAAVAANEPFLFYRGVGKKHFTGVTAFSLKGFLRSLQKLNKKSLEFHINSSDFERWAENSLNDKVLAEKLKQIRYQKLAGKILKKSLLQVVKERFNEVQTQSQTSTKYF